MTTVASPTLGELLQSRLPGITLHLPDDPDYDTERLAWNLTADQHPAVVALPTSTREVAAVVRVAPTLGLRIAPQATGHGAGALGDLSDVVLLRTSQMQGVSIDPAAGEVTVQAGTSWIDVITAAAEHGQAVLHGSSPDVGVVGYSLGGGIGWYARLHGLASNSIIRATVVTAKGKVVVTDRHIRPNLFWALRGGTGNFGIVTQLTFKTFPIADTYAGLLMWDWSHAEEVLSAWTAWAQTAPDAVTTSFRLMQMPPIEEIPEPFRGRQMVLIDGAVVGTDDQAAQILQPLRALNPELDTFQRVGVQALARLHMDPEVPSAAESRTALLHHLPASAQQALLASAGPGSGSSLLFVELRQLGGALSQSATGSGALSSVRGQFLLYAIGMALTPELAEASRSDAERVITAIAPWANGGQYLNFCDGQMDTAMAFTPEVWARLRAIRRTVDPDGRMVAQHVVSHR